MSIGLLGAFIAVGFVSFLFGLFYAALIEARDRRWMAKHLRSGTSNATQPTQQTATASAGPRR